MLTRRGLLRGATALTTAAILSPRRPRGDYASVDFETRGIRPLRSVGVHKYVEDPYFEPLCLGWAINDDEVKVWRAGQPMPGPLERHVRRGGWMHAWNAQFERLAWAAGCPAWEQVRRDRWRCTMVRALACGLPGALEKAAIAARIEERKDVEGAKAMEKVTRPRNAKAIKDGLALGVDVEPVWWDDPDLLEKTYSYCGQDVVTEREMGYWLPLLQSEEEERYRYDQVVADRGIYVDQDLCDAAMRVITVRQAELKERCNALTGANPTQVAKIVEWARKRDDRVQNLQKIPVAKLLRDPKLNSDVRNALLIRQEAGKSSTAKYRSMKERVCLDGTVKGARQFYGAHTGRWAGRGVQFDNMPRPTMDVNLDDVVAVVKTGESWLVESVYDDVMGPVQNSIRGTVIAEPDETLYVADFKSIESRMLAELSGQKSTNDAWRLSDRGLGPDVYVKNAAQMFGCTIKEAQHKDKRFWGKQNELGLGYEGGTGALLRQQVNSGQCYREIYDIVYRNADDAARSKVSFLWNLMGKTDEERGITEKDWRAARFCVERWRSDNKMSVKFWKMIRLTSVEAVRKPGVPMRYRGIVFTYSKKDQMLYCRLMSGRELKYPFAHLVTAKNFKGEPELQLRASYFSEDLYRFVKYSPYGGFLTENIDQGQSRDVMADKFPHLEHVGFRVRHTVHDELICSAKKSLGLTVNDYARIITMQSKWVPTLPIAVDAWMGPRYKKQE